MASETTSTMTPTHEPRGRLLATRLDRRVVLKRGLALGLSVPAVGALLAACGSSSKATATTGAATGAVKTPTTGTGTGGASGTTATGGASSPATGAGGTGQKVNMTDQLKFDPATLTIKVGDTVTWMNAGNAPHTATGDPSKAMNKADVKLPDGAEAWDSGMLNGGQTFSHTFTVAGEYDYICIPHEAAGMKGKVIVQ